jgi:hypothetical protein
VDRVQAADAGLTAHHVQQRGDAEIWNGQVITMKPPHCYKRWHLLTLSTYSHLIKSQFIFNRSHEVTSHGAGATNSRPMPVVVLPQNM